MPRYGNSFEYILIATLAGLATILILLSSAAASAGATKFRPPFDGTRRLTSFFDHQTPRCYWAGQPACDGYVWIYTGERVLDYTPHPYDGHEGIDWSMSDGTPVYAAASGAIVAFGAVGGYGNRIVVDHQNGYFTLYAHLQDFNNLWLGKPIVVGDLIGYSGHSGCGDCGAHLHFGVYHNDWVAGNETDPFGWRGSVPDPLIAYNGESATCLWRSIDEDPISCADTIVEDAGRGSTTTGTWTVGNRGNGYHTYYRTNTTDNGVQASWVTTSVVPGIYKVYAFIPEQPSGVQTPRTQQAQYSIWSDTGWQTRVISQAYTNQWVLLGTFRIPSAYAQVVLSANTGETAGTRLVMADAIKFRSYLDFLPFIRKDPTPTPSPTPPATATPIPPPTATPPPTAQCGQNALVNAGFESGPPGMPWQQYSSGGYQLVSAARPHTGSWGTYLGGYNNALEKIYQGFTVPAGANTATLEFWWYMSSQEPTSNPANDFLEIVLQSPPGNDLTGRAQIKNTDARDGWNKWTLPYSNLGAVVGQPIWVNFEAKTNASYITYFYVDDVSFVVQCGGASGQSSGDIPISPLATPTPRP